MSKTTPIQKLATKMINSYIKFKTYHWYYWSFLIGFFLFFGISFWVNNHFIKLIFLMIGLGSGIKFLSEFGKRK
jgi:hypothetical protein